MLDETPDTPDWQLLQLGRSLRDRRAVTDLWWAYYRGEPPLPQGPRKAKAAYIDFLKKARTNFCSVAVNASVFRMTATGITDAEGRPIDAAWDWWQRNKMDARQKQVYRTSLARSVAYVSIGPHPRQRRDSAGNPLPLILPEHPNEVITERDPETGETGVGLKAWWDRSTRRGRATLYRPDGILKYRTVRELGAQAALPWGAPSWELVEEAGNRYGVVPLVAYECRPELGEDPQPEFWAGMDVQDRINFGMLNRMTAERYSAFRQRYVTGHVFRKVKLPDGREVPDGNPFVPDPGSVWASEGKDTKFGEFSQTELMGYLKTHEADIRDFLVVTSTPAWLYSGDLINIATDTVQALDAMHVSKLGEHTTNFGENHEEVLSIGARVAEVDLDLSSAEMRWRDPRQLNPAVVADMAVKRKSIGYPLDVLAEDMGESPQRIRRIVAGATASQLLAATLAPQQPGQAAASPADQQRAQADAFQAALTQTG